MRHEGRRNALIGAAAYLVAWTLLSFVASSLVGGLPNPWWLAIPGAAIFYWLVGRFGGAIVRGRRL